jgi:tetratricopeptide (TPR) repeat protein
MKDAMTESPFRWTKQHELQSKGWELLTEKRLVEAEKILLSALEAEDDNPVDRHFVYNKLIELYYKLRDEREDALGRCIFFCEKDIDSLPEFFRVWKIQYPPIPDLSEEMSLPQCPSIERLAIIYEMKMEYQKAIDLCKYAIDLGLEATWDSYNQRYGTNKGFKARIQKLEKKRERAKK